MTSSLIEFNWTLIMIWVTVIVLFLILKKFFFQKVITFIEERENSIKDAFDGAEAVNRKADEKMENYNRKIADLENRGREIIQAAKTQADARANEIVDDAHLKAEEIITAAKLKVEQEQTRALSEMKNQISALALLAAEKIMERDLQLGGQEQSQIVNEIIEQAGSNRWQS